MAKILLVEDDALIRKLATLRLTMQGHEVEAAENGKIGYDKIQVSTYDLILLDMHMPVMSGDELIKLLRAEDYQGLVVALTADDLNNDGDNDFISGCNGIIQKPITEGFEAQVTTILDNLNQ